MCVVVASSVVIHPWTTKSHFTTTNERRVCSLEIKSSVNPDTLFYGFFSF